MLGDKGFVAILGAVMTVIYTSILVVVACALVCIGMWKVSETIFKKVRNAWQKPNRS